MNQSEIETSKRIARLYQTFNLKRQQVNKQVSDRFCYKEFFLSGYKCLMINIHDDDGTKYDLEKHRAPVITPQFKEKIGSSREGRLGIKTRFSFIWNQSGSLFQLSNINSSNWINH